MVDGGWDGAGGGGFTLSIDFGTAHTVAAVRLPGGQVSPLLFDATPLLRSAVYAAEPGRLSTGRDAERGARLDPARFEPYPKRRVDETAVLLGGVEFPVVELIAAVLRRVGHEAERVCAGSSARTVLTHPAGWGPQRRQVLLDAAGHAGLGRVTMLPEPFAAAHSFARSVGYQVTPGSALVVYDMGAGTFDISVNRHRGGGVWELVANDGLDDLGGLDLDALVVGRVGALVGESEPTLWQRLSHPSTTEERQQHQLLWDEARATKEQLSRASVATLRVPANGTDVHLTREEFEKAARPLLDRTVALTASTLFRTGIAADRVAGVLLVGGATRVPLVATLLHQRLGIAPTVMDQPELVVALGGLQAGAAPPEPAAHPIPPPPARPIIPPPPAAVAAAPPRPGRRRWVWAAAVAAVLAVAAGALVYLDPWSTKDPGGGDTDLSGVEAAAGTLGTPLTVTSKTADGSTSATIKVTLTGPDVSTQVDLGNGQVGRPADGVYVKFDAILEVVEGIYQFNTLHLHLVPKAQVAGWKEGDDNTVPEPVPGFEPTLKTRRMAQGDRASGSVVFDVPQAATSDAAVVLRSWLHPDGVAAAYWPL